MKNTYKTLLFIQLTLLAIFSLLIANTFTKNKILYKDTSSISIMSKINPTFDHSTEEKTTILEKNAKANGIMLTKIVWISEKELNLLTNDFTLNGYLDLDNQTELSTQEYLSNQGNTDSTAFDWIDNNMTIRIYPLDELHSLGVEGEYFVRSHNKSNIRNFMEDMNAESDLNIDQIDFNPLSDLQILKALFTQPILLAALIITIVSLMCSLIFLYIQSSKKIAIQVLSGYSKIQLGISLLKHSLKTVLFSILTSGVIGYLYMRYILKSFVLYKAFSGIYLVGLLSIVAIILFITAFWVWNFNRKNVIYEYIKEKRTYGLLITVSKIFQLVFLFLFPYLLVTTMNTVTSLHEFEEANSNWEDTQNIYSTSVQYVTSDYMEKRPYEEKIKTFYQENMDVFSIIDVSNYDHLSSGTPLYEANTTSKSDELISPDGRSITINATYLQWNSIYDKDGIKVNRSTIADNENSFTLLIPEKLRARTEKIKSKFYEEFIFRTYTIPHDIYEEDVERVEPEFNIIYVKDGQSYLTNNSSIEGDRDNLVIDPIVIVDTGNVDASQYRAWFSSSVFFKKAEGKTGYETIYPLLSSNGVADLIQIVTPIYNQRAKEIQENKEELYAYSSLMVFLLLSCFLCFYYFICSIFDKDQNKSRIRLYAGYSKFEIYVRMYFLWIALDLIVITTASIFFGLGAIPTLLFLLSMFILEILMVWILSMSNRMENKYDHFA